MRKIHVAKHSEKDMINKIFLAFIFGLLFSKYAYNQENNFKYEKITTEISRVEKGLSQNTVRNIFQDSKGFIWIGTWSGLNRFDGLNFKIFLPDINNPTKSISNAVINALAEDKNGFLWIATESGLNKLNTRTFAIKSFNEIAKPFYKNHSDTIYSLHSSSKYLWIGTHKGLVLKLNNKDSFFVPKTFVNTKYIADKEIRSIVKFSANQLLLGTNDGLVIIDINTFQIIKVIRTPTISSNSILSLLKIDESKILIGTENGLNRLDINKMINKVIKLDKNSLPYNPDLIMAMIKASDSLIWLATSGKGVFLLRNIAKSKYSVEKLKAENLNGNRLTEEIREELYYYSLLKSRDGTVWLGSAWSGIFKLVSDKNIFEGFQKSNKGNGLSDNQIWSFYNDGDKLWIGTQKGIDIYNKTSHKMTHLTSRGKIGYRFSSNNIRSIFKDSEGHFWIGTFQQGLNKYFPENGRIEVYLPEAKNSHFVADATVWKIVEDKHKNLWMATHNGLQMTNLTSGKTIVFKHNPMDSTSISNNVIYNVYFDKQGFLWLSTFDGLNKFDTKTYKSIIYKHHSANKKSLNTNKIFAIYQDNSMDYWIGTIGGGLNYINHKTNEITSFTTKEGLSNNIVYDIIDDNFGNLWLSTNCGISSFNLKNKVFTNYTVSDGLQSNEFNFGAALKDNFGNIYFGGMFGFNVLKPKDIQIASNNLKMLISEFSVNNGTTIYYVLPKETIRLNYNQNSFSIRFSLLDYKNPNKDIYQYKLEGVNNEWKTANSDDPLINFYKLPPGTYTLQVKGLNSLGVWTSDSKYKIIIKDAWYNLLWLKIAALLVIAAILFMLIRNRIKRINFEHESEKQLLELESQTLKLQMNPHFIFNTLNSIQSFILQNDVDKSISYLSKFSKLMRLLLINSRESNISLESEIYLLQSYLELENLRHQEGFDFVINVDENIEKEFIGIPPMIIQPFVENAVIHGLLPLKERRGKLQISISQEKNFIKVNIEDNGVGRNYYQENQQDKLHRPSGILITQKRLELINTQFSDKSSLKVTDLKDEQNNSLGTKVEILIQFTNIDDD